MYSSIAKVSEFLLFIMWNLSRLMSHNSIISQDSDYSWQMPTLSKILPTKLFKVDRKNIQLTTTKTDKQIELFKVALKFNLT